MEQIQILGKEVRDKVTGFTGVATSICFDLYGCVQVVVTPKANSAAKRESGWYDFHRLEVTKEKRVMPVPAYGTPARVDRGPAEKPRLPQGPER